MDMLKLLIADGTEEFRLALAEVLRGAYYVKTCSDGREAMEELRSFGPDVLVLDLMLPALDGISLLQQAAEAGICPMVLATSRFVNDYVLEAVDRLGVGYIMLKPCDIKAAADRIADLSRRICPPVMRKPDPKTNISNLLISLGISTKHRGYSYLREAVLLMAAHPGMSITKELYPSVGEICGVPSMHVERSSRSAIASAWGRRDERVWEIYFPPGKNGNVSRPTNAVFITRLADYLRLNESL